MKYPVYELTQAIPLRNRDYYIYLLDAIASARERIWASIFIVDIRDPYLLVRGVVENLTFAKWRNVDVKIIIGKSESTPDIQIADSTSAMYMKEKGLAVRIFNAPEDSSLHSKYVIIDRDKLVLGSHNWSHGAFSRYIEDSISVSSVDLVESLAGEFLKAWETSIEVG